MSAQVRAVATPESLVRDGEAALNAKRYRDAFDAFAAAAHARPRDVSLYAAAGYSAELLGQLADAQQWLERAIQIDPRYTTASVILGRVLYQQGKVADAVTALETALRYAPANEDVTRQLDEWRREADLQSRFFESRGAHFSVLFEGPTDDAVARRVIDVLEDGYYRIGGALNTYPSRTITVLLYTQQQFQDVTRSPGWTGGVYDGRIKLPVAGALTRGAELQRVAEHELVHAVVSTMAGTAVPTWLHEGLALMLEEGSGAWTDEVIARTPVRPSLVDLSNGFGAFTSEQAAVAYAQSAFAVKKLVALRGMPAVVSLIQDLGRGATFDSAFERQIFMRVREFDALVAR
ncbi:MAG: tetratricopeptide repeat protein [Vicinamibacterales bacterium]